MPEELRRGEPPRLPELAEPEIVRHFTALADRTFGVDTGFYPLGSCTMKHNPRVNERVVALPGFRDLHPLQEEDGAQGALELMWRLQEILAEVCGLHAVSLQPAAGSQGELTGLMLMRAYFADRGEAEQRKFVITADTAHGTNPASVTMAGFELKKVETDARGNLDLDDLRAKVNEETAGLMLTNPSTLGLFDEHIEEVAEIFHGAGALLYYDGANLNAVCGISRPGDMGFDIVHINLHKTFSQPHGGGGPGGGPVAVRDILEPFLPAPTVMQDGDEFRLDYNRPKSIGKVRGYTGPFGVFVRSYAFIRAYGPELRRMSEVAVLNANYMLSRLKSTYDLPFERLCMHEFVLSARNLKRDHGVNALDVAKRLMDYGFHPPTIYFPLIVPEALMIEPTETEPKETLDAFCDAMEKIAAGGSERSGDAEGGAAPPARPPPRRGQGREAGDRQVRLRPAPRPSGRAGRGRDRRGPEGRMTERVWSRQDIEDRVNVLRERHDGEAFAERDRGVLRGARARGAGGPPRDSPRALTRTCGAKRRARPAPRSGRLAAADVREDRGGRAQAARALRAPPALTMEVRSRKDAEAFTTLDGSTIRVLLDSALGGAANQSLAEASLDPGAVHAAALPRQVGGDLRLPRRRRRDGGRGRFARGRRRRRRPHPGGRVARDHRRPRGRPVPLLLRAAVLG